MLIEKNLNMFVLKKDGQLKKKIFLSLVALKLTSLTIWKLHSYYYKFLFKWQ